MADGGRAVLDPGSEIAGRGDRPADAKAEVEARRCGILHLGGGLRFQLRIEEAQAGRDQGVRHVDRGRGTADLQRLIAGEQVFELEAQRDVVGQEVVDARAERGGPRARLVLHREPEGRLLAIVELGQGDARAADHIGNEPIVPERVAGADLGHEGERAVLADRAEAAHPGKDLEVVSGELEAQIAVQVGAQPEAVVVVNARAGIGVAELQLQIPPGEVAILGPRRGAAITG